MGSESRRPFFCYLRFENFHDREMAVSAIVKNRTNASINRFGKDRAALIDAAVTSKIDMPDPKMSEMTS